MTPLLILLLVYSAALVALGAWIGRSVRKSEDFFVGGRALGAGLLFSTFMAANIGAGSTVNATGLAYHYGFAAWWWNGAAGIGTLILAFWIGPRMWRLASAHGFLTVGDFLENRFGGDVRLVAALVIWIGSLSIYAAQIIGASAVLEVVGGVSKPAGVLISTIAMTAYFASGGLLSAAWVNRVQLLVIISGFALAVPMAINGAGGWAPMMNAVPESTLWSNPAPNVGWPMLFLTGPAFFLSPGLVQRAFGASDERALRRGVGWAGLALMVFALAPVVLGVAARAMFPEISTGRADEANVLPYLLTHGVPVIVGSIALAAVFSAEVSSADAVLYMLSTSGARDVYRGVFNPTADDATVLKVARRIAVAAGVLGIAFAFVHDSVRQALSTFYGVLTVTLLAPILGGLFLPKGGRPAALGAMTTGVLALLVTPYWLEGRDTWMTSAFLGIVSSSLTYLAVALNRR